MTTSNKNTYHEAEDLISDVREREIALGCGAGYL